MPRVLMFCPCFRFKEQEAIENHRQIMRYAGHEVDYVKITGHSVEHAKEIAYIEFLKKKYDFFFCIDADIIALDPKDDNPIDKLILADKDIIGGVYVVKRPPYFPSHRTVSLQTLWEKEGSPPENYNFEIPNEIHEVTYLAGGCVMSKREVIESLVKKFQIPNLPMIHPITKEYLSEDFAFCYRARALGYNIFADPTIKLGHLGRYSFTIEDYKRFNKIGGENGKET